MNKLLFFLAAVCTILISCTKDKTDYEAEIDNTSNYNTDFKEVTTIRNSNHNISIEALNGTFYKGYNEVRLKITNGQNGISINPATIAFLPIMSDAKGAKTSCPHQSELLYQSETTYFTGYVVFTHESADNINWELHLSYTAENQKHRIKKNIVVAKQTNKNRNMTSCIGNDGEQYFIALIAPQRPKAAENELVAGIYKFNKPILPPTGDFPDPSQFSYSEVKGHTLQLDPRMPEPSMGNHSSPNNTDLTQQSDGLYHGIVNYTMTGNWTLNFILLNQEGQTLKGTTVPKDFTPGVEGVKSELYIDILF